MRFGRQLCGDLDAASSREWLVTDGIGGFAMGTVGGLRTRRYHGLLVVATEPPGGRMLALAALDPVLVVGDVRYGLAVHEWSDGTVDPRGHEQLSTFELEDGVPCWRWQIGDVVLEREIAAEYGRSATAIVHRLVAAPGSVHLELAALGTWRNGHGERFADGSPAVEHVADGYVFEGSYRVEGPGFAPTGEWFRGVRYREEAARGLGDREDLWHAGTFAADLTAGEVMTVRAWAGDVEAVPQPGPALVGAARARARALISRAHATDEVEARLALAADQFVVAGPTVVAGYPWFGDVTLTGGSIQTRVASMPTPVRELLEEPNFVHLSTLRKDGSPRNWVVWVGLEGDRILVCTSSTQLKAQDMRRDPRVALSVTANDNPYRMAVVQGRVIEERPDHDCRFMNPIAIKYTSHPWPSPGPNRVCFVIGIDRAAERTLDFPNTPA